MHITRSTYTDFTQEAANDSKKGMSWFLRSISSGDAISPLILCNQYRKVAKLEYSHKSVSPLL